RGGGLSYGWVVVGGGAPQAMTTETRDRNRVGIAQELDTIVHMERTGGTFGWWEIAVPNGNYFVTVSVGDQPDPVNGYDSTHIIQAEGTTLISGFVGNGGQEYSQGSGVANVTDGRLTIDDVGGVNTKMNYVVIQALAEGTVISVPNEGTVRIDSTSPSPLFSTPGGQAVTNADGSPISLPRDTGNDGFDTYVVTDVQTFNGEVWLAIFVGSQIWGWVPLNAVSLVTPINGLDSAISSAGIATGPASNPILDSGYTIVNTSRLNMRSGDGAGFSIVTILRGGTELSILGRNDDATWWFVTDGTNEGWVNADFIILRGDLTEAVVEEGEGELITPTFYVFGNAMIYSTTSTLRSNRVCEIPGNAEYDVLGRNVSSGWLLIEADCRGPIVGWIETSEGALRNGNIATIPVR
ncbi:MAG: SH3 domain-containing protein, partial [Aggregatilineales bacterium]